MPMLDFFTKKKREIFRNALDELRQAVTADVERVFEKTAAALAERLSGLEEQLRQIGRQERRSQTALESLLENQTKILENQEKTLEILGRPESFPPAEAAMALAENFVLSFLAEPENPASLVLYGKVNAFLACFGLSLVADVNCAFDPERHEACAARRDPSRPENTVLEVVRPGFLSGGGKVLRCAMVVVNRYDAESGAPGSDGWDSDIRAEPKLWEGDFYV